MSQVFLRAEPGVEVELPLEGTVTLGRANLKAWALFIPQQLDTLSKKVSRSHIEVSFCAGDTPCCNVKRVGKAGTHFRRRGGEPQPLGTEPIELHAGDQFWLLRTDEGNFFPFSVEARDPSCGDAPRRRLVFNSPSSEARS
jgi:hypothetical protein